MAELNVEEISDKKFHRHIDQLYNYIMANGYRFNTHVGAVFFASLYQDNKRLAYDFMDKAHAFLEARESGDENAIFVLSPTEGEHLHFALKATSLKHRLLNASNEGVAKALAGPCGRREFLRIVRNAAVTVATAPILQRLESLFEDAVMEPPSPGDEQEMQDVETEQERKWSPEKEARDCWKSPTVRTAGAVALGGTAILALRNYFPQRNEKRDEILDDLADLCRNPRIQAQLPRETSVQR